jgi:hypothetical protein
MTRRTRRIEKPWEKDAQLLLVWIHPSFHPAQWFHWLPLCAFKPTNELTHCSLLLLSGMNVIMPTAMITMHLDDEEQSVNLARTANRGVRVLRALQQQPQECRPEDDLVTTHVQAILALATTDQPPAVKVRASDDNHDQLAVSSKVDPKLVKVRLEETSGRNEWMNNYINQSNPYCNQLATLVDAVHCHPLLAWLDLSEKSIGPDTCEALVSLLMEDIDGIAGTTTSHLAGPTLIGGGIQDAEVTKLASALYSNSVIFIIFCLRDYILS